MDENWKGLWAVQKCLEKVREDREKADCRCTYGSVTAALAVMALKVARNDTRASFILPGSFWPRVILRGVVDSAECRRI